MYPFLRHFSSYLILLGSNEYFSIGVVEFRSIEGLISSNLSKGVFMTNSPQDTGSFRINFEEVSYCITREGEMYIATLTTPGELKDSSFHEVYVTEAEAKSLSPQQAVKLLQRFISDAVAYGKTHIDSQGRGKAFVLDHKI